MPTKILQAGVKVPEMPTVRFLKKAEAGGEKPFTDVTNDVARIEIESLDEAELHWLNRLNTEGALVWRTLHQSLDEARWQAKFEYGTEVKEFDLVSTQTA